jgi:hypothetical protein
MLRITVTIVPFGKDGKDRKHGVMQSFWSLDNIVIFSCAVLLFLSTLE